MVQFIRSYYPQMPPNTPFLAYPFKGSVWSCPRPWKMLQIQWTCYTVII